MGDRECYSNVCSHEESKENRLSYTTMSVPQDGGERRLIDSAQWKVSIMMVMNLSRMIIIIVSLVTIHDG